MAPSETLWKEIADPFGTLSQYDNKLVNDPDSTKVRLSVWLVTVPITVLSYSSELSIVRIIRFSRTWLLGSGSAIKMPP
jgi:hypothetical protein